MNVNETNLQNNIRLELSKYGIVLRLNTGLFNTLDGRTISSGLPPGVSDLLFIGNGKIAFIEVKTQTGRLRPEQEKFINLIKSLGHIAGVARSVEEAVELINLRRINQWDSQSITTK